MSIVPAHWYSWDFSLTSGDRTIARLDFSSWRERGDIVIRDVTYRVFRASAFGGDFIIETAGHELARASKPSAFRSTIVLQFNGREYTLRQPSIWRREFVIEDDDQQLGTITPANMWTRHATADLPADWPEPVATFAVWLILLMWKREMEAAA